MKKIVFWISNSMVSNGTILAEEQELYNFGIECAILKVIHYISYIVIAILFKGVFELMIIACAFLPLRKNAGGYHARTRMGCYIASCLMVFVALLICKYKFSNEVYFICWLVSSSIIFIFAPMDNENKKMCQIEVLQYKKKSRIVILIIASVVLCCWILKYTNISRILICGVAMSAICIIISKFMKQFESRKNKLLCKKLKY